METLHIPAPGQSFIGKLHTPSPECPCEPKRHAVTKANSSGRGGSHQGYKVVRIEWRHQFIEQTQEA